MIKVSYDEQTGLVKGFYPENVQYSFIPEPYIKISKEEHDLLLGKELIVIEGLIQENCPTNEQVLDSKKKSKIFSRLKYLKDTDWQASAFIKYGRPIDEEVKEKCLRALEEINKIKITNSLNELNQFREIF